MYTGTNNSSCYRLKILHIEIAREEKNLDKIPKKIPDQKSAWPTLPSLTITSNRHLRQSIEMEQSCSNTCLGTCVPQYSGSRRKKYHL